MKHIYLDSTVHLNNLLLLLLNGYNLFRADRPDNVKRGDVCLYHRGNLTLRLVDAPYIDQCIFLCDKHSKYNRVRSCHIQITWSVQ